MYWMYVLIAGIFEMGFAISLKYTHGFSQLIPSIATLACMIGSLFFLSLALRHLPIGIAYAIWTGIGIIGTAVAGIFIFHESATPWQVLSLILIIAGIVGLRLTSAA